MKPLPVGQRVLLVVGLVPFLLSIPLALVVAIAEWFPTSWLIAVQVRWNDGSYYSKLTFLFTWLAILLATSGASSRSSAFVDEGGQAGC